MTLDFIAFSTVFHSYQDAKRVIMKGCAQQTIHLAEMVIMKGH